jgi:hypothetical protein
MMPAWLWQYVQTCKELAGLHECQVRCWTFWHRWTIVVPLAHAFPGRPGRSPA